MQKISSVQVIKLKSNWTQLIIDMQGREQVQLIYFVCRGFVIIEVAVASIFYKKVIIFTQIVMWYYHTRKHNAYYFYQCDIFKHWKGVYYDKISILGEKLIKMIPE